MTRKLWLDDESFSPEPITNGAHKYAESVEILIRALALDDGDVIVRDLTPGGQDWRLIGDEVEPALPAHVAELDRALEDDTIEVWAQNSAFDRTIERHAGLQIPLHRWRDTMVQALAHSLPGSLGAMCEVLRIPTDKAKDKAGKALITLFCKPPGANLKRGRATRETHPEEWKRFLVYAGQDIIAMRECHKRMPMWNYKGDELALWHLDQKINDRGVAIDLDLAAAAVRAVDLAQIGLKEQVQEATNGEVDSATRVDAMLLHILAEYGVDLPDMQKATLERRVADPDLPEGLRELLRIRIQASATSTSKYKVLMRATSSDGRLRGLLQFCGAARTGRWAGRIFQPQNLPSRGLLPQDDVEAGIIALKDDCAHLLFDNVMKLTSSTIRGCIAASLGKKLVVADLSNIEGRVLAWLGGETWKLKAFRDFDAGTGFDLYKLAYAKSFGVSPEDVDKGQRQIGKVQELALGYAGGVGAFLTFAAAYGIDLEQLAEQAFRAIPQSIMAQANIMFEWHRDKKKKDPAAAVGLSKQAWLVCESFKLAWREAHPATVNLWNDLENAVRHAIDTPGKTVPCGRLKVRRDGAWLRIGLPSGRALCYPSPEIVDGTITYMGMNQYTRKWERLRTYSGKLVENCIAGGTEVLTEAGWVPIELAAGYRVWDGVEWVSHNGCVYKGKQVVLSNYGVHMTPDHLVLTEKGWKNASSCEGLNRGEVGLPDGYPLHRLRPEEVDLGSEMRMRHAEADAGARVREAAEEGDCSVLRLYASSDDRPAEYHPRHVGAPGVCGVAQHERSLPPGVTSGIPQLRRAGYRGLRTVARVVRELLGRYGADVSNWRIDRAQGQRTGVWAGELPLAVAAPAGEQQTHLSPDRHANGPDHRQSSSPALRHLRGHAVLPPGSRVERRTRVEPVYDLVNCGPRNRFVVRGSDGRPLIVHNCTQAIARDVMASSMPEIELAMYEIVLTIHDECVTEAPDDPFWNADALSAIMATPPAWAPDMPLAAAGFESMRYRKD